MSADHRDDIPPELLELLRAEVEVEVKAVSLDELGHLLGGDTLSEISHLLDTLMATAAGHVRYPPRDCDEYRIMLQDGATTTDTKDLVAGIGQMWTGYGWKGIVDFQEVLIHQMIRLTSPVVQDSYGRTRLDRLLRTEPDEGTLLETAVTLTNQPGAAEVGMDSFSAAYDFGLQMVKNNQPWMEVFQRALDAACSPGREKEVWPILMRLPGLRGPDADRDRVVQGTLMLGMAAMALRDPFQTAENLLNAGTPPGEIHPPLMRAMRRKRRK